MFEVEVNFVVNYPESMQVSRYLPIRILVEVGENILESAKTYIEKVALRKEDRLLGNRIVFTGVVVLGTFPTTELEDEWGRKTMLTGVKTPVQPPAVKGGKNG